MLIGYGRVSTAEQNAAHQVDALVRAGVAERDIHTDTASGAKASRPQLDLVLQLLRDGDTLVITRLDRLSRSVLHLITLGAELRDRGIGLKVTEQGIDTTTAEGRAMFGMLSVLAELQRELIMANTRDGLAAARARGRTSGRRPRLTPDQVELAQQLYDERKKTVQQIAASPRPPPAAAPPTPTTASAPTSSAPPAPSPSATAAGSTTSASAGPTPEPTS
jgi:DNA invertase Pin-like site-specific DNA recombinase